MAGRCPSTQSRSSPRSAASRCTEHHRPDISAARSSGRAARCAWRVRRATPSASAAALIVSPARISASSSRGWISATGLPLGLPFGACLGSAAAWHRWGNRCQHHALRCRRSPTGGHRPAFISSSIFVPAGLGGTGRRGAASTTALGSGRWARCAQRVRWPMSSPAAAALIVRLSRIACGSVCGSMRTAGRPRRGSTGTAGVLGLGSLQNRATGLLREAGSTLLPKEAAEPLDGGAFGNRKPLFIVG